MSTQPGTLLKVADEASLKPEAANQELLRRGRSAEDQSDFEEIQPVNHASGHTRRIIMGAAKDTGNAQSNAPASTCNRVDSRYLATIHHGNQRQIREQLQVQANTDNVDKSAKNSKQGTWSSWWDSAVSSVSAACELGKNAAIGLGKLCKDVGHIAKKVAIEVVQNPEKVLATTCSIAKSVRKFAFSAGELAVTGICKGAIWCIAHPDKILSAVGSFLYSAGKTIFSILGGVFSSLWEGVKSVWRGEVTIGQALLKTFAFACEMTGLADAWGVVKHGALAFAAYGSGDKQAMFQHLGQVALHGTFLAIALATVGTAGVAAPVFVPLMAMRSLIGAALKQGIKQGIKACAREFLECGAKQIAEGAIKNMGEPAVTKLAKELPEELVKVAAMAEKAVGTSATAEVLARKTQELALERVIQLQGENIAKTMGKSMSEDITKIGAEKVLMATYVEGLGEKVGKEQTKALLQQLGLVDYVDDLTFKLLSPMKEMTGKQARKHIIDTMGVSSKEAGKIARNVQRLITRGKSDDAIKQILEEHITNDVSKFVAGKMENSFKDTFRKGLRGELTDPDNVAWSRHLKEAIEKRAMDLGKQVDELTDDLVEAGWKGVQKGIKQATSELVREGLESAFKRLREESRRPRSPGGNSGNQAELILAQSVLSDVARHGDDARPHSQGAAAESEENRGGSGRELEECIQEITRADGTTVQMVRIYEGERLVSQVEQLESAPGSANPRRGGVNHNPERSGEGLVAKSPNSDLKRKSTLAI
jgi:hypothetical protein